MRAGGGVSASGAGFTVGLPASPAEAAADKNLLNVEVFGLLKSGIDKDQALAEAGAQRLEDMMWAARDQLTPDLPNPAEAVRLAMNATATPVALFDAGDNVGGGSAATCDAGCCDNGTCRSPTVMNCAAGQSAIWHRLKVR